MSLSVTGVTMAKEIELDTPYNNLSMPLISNVKVSYPFVWCFIFCLVYIINACHKGTKLASSLIKKYVCINLISRGNESGGINTIKTRQIPHVFNPHKNSIGNIHIASGT